MKSNITVLGVVLALNACVPFPNRRLCAPEVSGTLVRAGVPVSGAEVLLSAVFTEDTAAVLSDGAGKFKLGPLSKLHLTKSVLGDPLYRFSLRVKVPGGGESLAFEGSALGAPPGPLVLYCDLERVGVRSGRPGFCVDSKGRAEGK
ncbi:MAG: hypothetical protein HY928_04335 [Elusimicrobia bacterium]|nr:hypothetical protein [Elusimicrobiota bacterium]